MRDIVVTTPKSQIATAAEEAAWCLKHGGWNHYFRFLNSMPKDFGPKSKLFYAEDGFVRGFCEVARIHQNIDYVCKTTGRHWYGRYVALMRADSWSWVKPISMKGFQGWRYFSLPYSIVGTWTDPKPTA